MHLHIVLSYLHGIEGYLDYIKDRKSYYHTGCSAGIDINYLLIARARKQPMS